MIHRRLSEAVGEVSVIGIGGNLFGYACDAAQTKEILSAAKHLGVNFIDTADVYSNGLSEEMIGNALSGHRKQWVIATKVGVKSGESGRGKASRKMIHDRVDKSLKRLKTDYIDLYQIHHFDVDTPIEETIDAMQQLLSIGKIREFGVSNFTAKQVAETLAKEHARARPVTNQVHFNLLKRERVIDYVKRSTSGWPKLLVYGVLGRGILGDRYQENSYIPSNSRAAQSSSVRADLQPSLMRVVKELRTLAGLNGLTTSQLAVYFATRNPAILSAIVGFRTVEQLEEIANQPNAINNRNFWAAIDSYVDTVQALREVSLGDPLLTK